MPINSFLYPGAKVSPAYEVANSCRFNDDDSACLNRSNGSSPSSQRIFTFSAWVKRGNLGSNNQTFMCIQDTGDGDPRVRCAFRDDDKLYFDVSASDGSGDFDVRTTRVFRDVGAWYHFVFRIDTTQSTAADRVKMYVNGSQITSFSTATYGSQNYDLPTNLDEINIGTVDNNSRTNFFDGYLAEVVYCDGQSLAPSSFGEFDEDSPTIWKPKDVSGLTFGTNGFYLDFEDSGTLGNDANGGTDFTANNLAATDQSTDTPTNNFCVLNSLDNYLQSATFSEGNLKIVTAGSSNTASTLGTFGVNKGKWFWEAKFVSDSQGSSYGVIGIEGAQVTSATDALLEGTQSYGLYLNDGKIWTNNGSNNHGAHIDLNAIIGVALDLDNNRIYFSKDGQWGDGSGNWDEASPNNYLSVTAAASVALGNYFPAHGDWSSGTIGWEVNFGNPVYSISSGNADANGYGNFEYSVPSGYYSLCSKNLAEFG